MGDVRGGERRGDLGGDDSLGSASGSMLNTGATGRLKLLLGRKNDNVALR